MVFSHRYHSNYAHKRLAGTCMRYMYHHVQNFKCQHKSKKVDDHKKQCDKEAMVTFKCAGWLHIAISDDPDLAFVKIGHHNDHVPYLPIDIPPDVEEMICTNTQMTPTQVIVFMCLRTSY
jgi:hypothetical protein